MSRYQGETGHATVGGSLLPLLLGSSSATFGALLLPSQVVISQQETMLTRLIERLESEFAV
ncbi:MAG: hypothetical protein M9950_10325, partial [Thermomicrobiales bacterium]|nr:hypothetical protein [Thermomicrobiales bacterium]